VAVVERRLGLALALVWMTASGAAAGVASRADCAAACVVTIAQCATVCGQFATLNTPCRRGVLKRCQREGVGVCAPPTTTVATTLAPASTTSVSTTTHKPTTSTTQPQGGLSCASPRPLAVGATVSGNTGSGIDHGPGAGCMQNSESPDLIYVIVPQADGTLTLSLTSDWDGGLYVRTDCGDAQTELVCTDAFGDNATEVLQVGVTASTSYYVYVDGYTSESYGTFSLTTALE
jgi:hypothetical protein